MKNSRKFLKLTAAAGLMTVASGAHAVQVASDPMINTATVVGSCIVVATGINFGIVPNPMIIDIPGVLPNINDTTTIPVIPDLLGVTLAAPGVVPGVQVVCTQSPNSITVTLENGQSADLLTSPAASLNGEMSQVGGTATLDYTLKFVGLSTPDLSVPGLLPVGLYAGAFLVDPTATKIPVQGIDAAGVYTDTANVTVDY